MELQGEEALDYLNNRWKFNNFHFHFFFPGRWHWVDTASRSLSSIRCQQKRALPLLPSLFSSSLPHQTLDPIGLDLQPPLPLQNRFPIFYFQEFNLTWAGCVQWGSEWSQCWVSSQACGVAAQGGPWRLGWAPLFHWDGGEEDGGGEGLVPDHPDGRESGGVDGDSQRGPHGQHERGKEGHFHVHLREKMSQVRQTLN